MEKRKKTHVDYVLEREIRHAYDVLDDLKFIVASGSTARLPNAAMAKPSIVNLH